MGAAAGNVVEVIGRWNDWIEMTALITALWLAEYFLRFRRS